MPAEPDRDGPVRPQRRPDASMTLLNEVMQRPLDAGYAMAAERRAAGRRARRRDRVAAAVLAALCALITTWAVVQLRRPEPETVAARRSLEQEIQRRVDAVDRLRAANTLLREQIAAAREETLSGAGDADIAGQVRELARLAGETAVSGPGVEVELVDAPAAADASRGKVLDRDIQVVVNALWAAGAEAVEVNGHRLTAVSAIRRAGEAVLVDLQPVLPPYRVRAIGPPDELAARFVAGVGGAYLDVLRRDGIRAGLTESSALDLAAGVNTVMLVHARPYGPATEVSR